MKILFSPSETKISAGAGQHFNKDSFIFPELFEKRVEILDAYNIYLQNAQDSELEKLFGTKKSDILKKYRTNIFKASTIKAIKRYDGVAYKHLCYNELDEVAQAYIDKNVLIFSNLFGVLRARDCIPDYRLKQAMSFNDLKIEQFYNDNFSKAIDAYLEDDDILDLRAGFYERFYTIKKSYTTLKFLKDSKVLSHFAKAYRGEVLRVVAQNGIKTIDEFMNLEIKNLHIKEIKLQKNKREIVFDIIG